MCGLTQSERGVFSAWAKRPAFLAKVEAARNIIIKSFEIAPCYVGISWGKDSIVLLHLAQQVSPEIPAISFTHPDRDLIANYADVEAEYCHQFSPNLINISMDGDHVPDKVNAARIWDTYPVALLGIRKEESQKRSIAISQYGVTYQYQSGARKGSWRCFPLAFWTWQDVWAYTAASDLPCLNAYALQPKSTGRTTDHFSKSASKTWQQTRLAKLQQINPNYFRHLQQTYPEMF